MKNKLVTTGGSLIYEVVDVIHPAKWECKLFGTEIYDKINPSVLREATDEEIAKAVKEHILGLSSYSEDQPFSHSHFSFNNSIRIIPKHKGGYFIKITVA